MAKYGLPYMGSKGGICDDLVKLFPPADHFYDLFGGGFSVTHAMLLKRSKSFKHFHFNELRPGICDLIKDAIEGKYNYDVFKPEWISRERFFKELETNPYIKICWSFGNDGKNYIFGDDIEEYKKSMHMAVVFNEFDELAKKVFGFEKFKDGYSINEKRLFLRNKIEYYRLNGVPEFLHKYISPEQLERLQQLERLEQLERLQQLQQLQQLEQLERLQQLTFYNTSYENVEIRDNSIIYCDPPYAGTADYGNNFNHKKFLDWAHEQKNPVFISEYNISDKRFYQVFKIKKRSMLSANKEKCINKEERVYVNEAGFRHLRKRRLGI